VHAELNHGNQAMKKNTTRMFCIGSVIATLALAVPVAQAAPGEPGKVSAGKKKAAKKRLTRAEREEAAATEIRRDELQTALNTAASQRDEEVARVQPLLVGGSPEQAAIRLHEAADRLVDPVLYLEASEHYLAAADRRRPDALARGREAAKAGRALLEKQGDPMSDPTIDVRSERVAHASVAALLGRSDELQQRLATREKQLKRQRRGRQEIGAGASLLVIGVGGGVILANGLVYRAAGRRELADIKGHEAEYDLSALDAQGRRAEGMIGAGAAVGVIGLALGVSLMVLGARDLRGERRPEMASLRIAPSFNGMAISGRF